MEHKPLQPENFLALQIQIDRLNRAAEQCRTGLRRMRSGELTPEAYQELLHLQMNEQREWEAKNRECFCTSE